VSVGFGIDLTYVKVQLRQRVDLAPQMLTPTISFATLGVPSGTDFADVDLSGHTWATSFHFGVLAKLNAKLSVGARYLTNGTGKVDDGELTTTQIKTGRVLPVALGPTLPAGTPIDALLASKFADGQVLETGQKGMAELPMPAQLVMGVAYKASEKATVFADYRFVQWSKFDQLVITKENSSSPTVTVEDYRNASALHLGVEYEVSPKLVARGGFFANSAAAPDQTVTPNLPEGARTNYAFGVGVKLTETTRVDFAYQYLKQSDRDGRTTDGGLARPTVAVNNGVYRFHANIIGVMFSGRF